MTSHSPSKKQLKNKLITIIIVIAIFYAFANLYFFYLGISGKISPKTLGIVRLLSIVIGILIFYLTKRLFVENNRVFKDLAPEEEKEVLSRLKDVQEGKNLISNEEFKEWLKKELEEEEQ